MRTRLGCRRAVASAAALLVSATWFLVPLSGGASASDTAGYELLALHSDKALDVAGASLDDGAGVIQWPVNAGDNQRWLPQPVGDGSIVFENVNSGKVLDVAGASTDNGAPVIQWEPNGGANQAWRLYPVGPDYVVFINVGSGRALDVSGGSFDDGAGIIQWDWNGGANQLFRGVLVDTIAVGQD